MPLNARQLFAAPTRFPGLGSFSAKPAIFGRARGRRRPPLSGHADRPAHSGPQRNLRALERVQHYSRSILAIRNGHEIVGCFAALLLNHDGFERLLDGDLNVSDPSQSHLVRPGETAAAIYVWAICMTGMAAGATGNVMEWLRHEIYAKAELYARPSTPKGRAFLIRLGFHPLAASEPNSLWAYRRTM